MTLEEKFRLAGWLEPVIPALVALLVFAVFSVIKQRFLGAIPGILLGWICAYQFRVNVVSELGMEYFDSVDPDSQWDGVTSNAIALVFGWVPPLLAILLALLLRAIWRFSRRYVHAKRIRPNHA